MIENKLQKYELARLLNPFLRLADANSAFPELSDVLGFQIEKNDDIVCQDKILITYKGYRVDIRDLRQVDESGLAVCIQFKAKKKWWHGLFMDQNRAILNDLKEICLSGINGLYFALYNTTHTEDPLTDQGSTDAIFYHDARAFNPHWRQGHDISPLLIAPDMHHGNCFVEFQFNPGGYRRHDDTTIIRDDWIANVSKISEGIERSARRLLGLE